MYLLSSDSLSGQLASSIHTIHRPVARSRRTDVPSLSVRLERVDSDPEEIGLEHGVEVGDFERIPRPTYSVPDVMAPMALSGKPDAVPRRAAMNRSGSMATVRLQRRARLAEKLQDVFELKDITEVWAELPCWLLRSVCELPHHVYHRETS